MPRVTFTLPLGNDNANMDDPGYRIFVDGKKVSRSFTPETDRAGVERFVAQLELVASLLVEYEAEKDRCLELNAELQRNGQNGKNWPIFNKLEKLLNAAQKRAGIIDT